MKATLDMSIDDLKLLRAALVVQSNRILQEQQSGVGLLEILRNAVEQLDAQIYPKVREK